MENLFSNGNIIPNKKTNQFKRNYKCCFRQFCHHLSPRLAPIYILHAVLTLFHPNALCSCWVVVPPFAAIVAAVLLKQCPVYVSGLSNCKIVSTSLPIRYNMSNVETLQVPLAGMPLIKGPTTSHRHSSAIR